MDNRGTVTDECENNIVKEELIIKHEYDIDIKEETSLDYTDTIVDSLDSTGDVKTRTLHEEEEQSSKVGELEKFSCDLCDFNVSLEDEMRNHYLHNHAIGASQERGPRKSSAGKFKKYKCPHCDYCSYLTAHVKRHVLIHTGETPYGCPNCDFKTRDTSTLKRHIRTQHENKIDKPTVRGSVYKCEKCTYTARDRRWLTRHELTCHNFTTSRFQCPHCEFRCMQKNTFTNHVLMHNGIASHICQQCDYRTNIPTELNKHMMRKHTDKKPFECTECNYKTNSRSDLTKHSVIHKNVRPYSCSRCDYKCKRSGHLVAHQSVHDKNFGKYVCSFCKFKSLNIACLKIHVRKHTGEKPYECGDCDAKFSSRAGLKSHAFSHQESWSQSCSICEFTTDKPQVFKSHIRTHHGYNQCNRRNGKAKPNADSSSSE